jgi:hypothetical protein
MLLLRMGSGLAAMAAEDTEERRRMTVSETLLSDLVL